MTEQEEFEFRLRLEQERGQTPPPAMAAHAYSASQIMPQQSSQWADIPAGAVKALDDMWMGLKQRGTELFGSKEDADALRQQVAEQRAAAEKEALLKGPKSLAFTAGEVGTKTLPLMAASAVPGGQTWLGAGAIGALGGLMEPSTSNAETGRNAGLGGLSAAGTSLGARFFMPRTSISQAQQGVNKAAERTGLPLTGGQMTNLEYVQMAERAGLRNPLTRKYLGWVSRKQEDQFVKDILMRSGVPEEAIPKNPSLSPEMLKEADAIIGRQLDQNFVGKLYKPADLDPAFRVAARLRFFSHTDKEAEKLVREAADTILSYQTSAPKNLSAYRGEIIQDWIEALKESTHNAYAKAPRAGEALGILRDAMIGSLKDPDLYREAAGNYARLKTAEEVLRASTGQIGRGTPDPTKLARVMERNIPGSVIHNRGGMADLARAGEATAGKEALPERITGWPHPRDIFNASTVYRFNNPVAKWGFRNPLYRDIAETMTRYLPYTTGSSEASVEEARQWWDAMRGKK